MNKRVELLSPVGSQESLLAAIENGADAVYLGGKMFNARKFAENFENEELKCAVEYAHSRGVKVYVVVNIILRDEELKEAIDYIIYLYNIDVDALIIQDLGLFRMIRRLIPDFELHGSTQMSINNYLGASMLKELGFERVVLSRELSIEEIEEINEKADIELEIFVHGALCVSYSGQCLMSSMIGGRSGNRGSCAQPCRMKYTIVDRKNNISLDKQFDEKHILSLKDLNTIDDLEEIINAGVVSLKIEGRMKKPEYVATITEKYRKNIDNIYQSGQYSADGKAKDEMAQMFNRGFTRGFLQNDFGRNIVTLDKPNNRGIFIGEVIKLDNKHTYIKLKGSLNIGDGIEIVDGSGNGKGLIIDSIQLDKGVAKIKSVREARVGNHVYKTLDIELNEKARNSFRKVEMDKKYPLDMKIDIQIDQPVILTVIDNGLEVVVESDEVAELARKVGLTQDRVKEQMEKLGDTPYRLMDISINIDENSMVRVSVLNNLRRLAVEKLAETRRDFNKRETIDRKDLIMKIDEIFSFPKNTNNKNRRITVKVDKFEQLNSLDLNKINRIYMNFSTGLKQAIDELKKYPVEIYLATGNIIENQEFIEMKRTFDSIIDRVDGISISNIGTLKFIRDNYKTKIHGDIGLNSFNSQTIQLFKEYGVDSITLSPELKLSQIDKICKNQIMDYEVIGYGYLPLMTMKHCPMSVIKNCKSTEECKTCKLKEGYGLLDRKNMIFDFKRFGSSTIIYNSQAIMIPEYLNKIYNSNVDMVRLDFTKENNIEDIQSLYYDFANYNIDIEEVEKRVEKLKTKEGATKGHFFRGVL